MPVEEKSANRVLITSESRILSPRIKLLTNPSRPFDYSHSCECAPLHSCGNELRNYWISKRVTNDPDYTLPPFPMLNSDARAHAHTPKARRPSVGDIYRVKSAGSPWRPRPALVEGEEKRKRCIITTATWVVIKAAKTQRGSFPLASIEMSGRRRQRPIQEGETAPRERRGAAAQESGG